MTLLARSFRCALALALMPAALAPALAEPIWKRSTVPHPIETAKMVSGETTTVDLLAAAEGGLVESAKVVKVTGAPGLSATADQGTTQVTVSSTTEANGSGLVTVEVTLEDGSTQTVAFPATAQPKPRHTFRFTPGSPVQTAFVAGPFNGWTPGKDALTDTDGDGTYEATVAIDAGRYPYKFVVNGEWILDPANPEKMSEGGFENSAVTVRGAATAKPLSFTPIPARSPEGGEHGAFAATLGEEAAALDPESAVVLINNVPLSQDEFSVDSENGMIRLRARRAPEQWVTVLASDTAGNTGFATFPWDRAEAPRSPRDEVLYYAVVDRFRNGDSANDNPVQDPELAEIGNFQGGDFAGVASAIQEGYFEDLGVTALWLSPVNRQPDAAYRDAIPPNRKFSGYHGYWPVANNETHPSFGTLEELKGLVDAAHGEGMAVLLDFVANHVHEEHPMVQEHPEWIVPLELPNGEKNIRKFDEHPFTTWFDTFLPSLDYMEQPNLVDLMTDVAVWWIETTGADGFRHDAVKHVPPVFWTALTQQLRSDIMEPQEKRLFQVGESIASRGTISDFLGPKMLDGQFDFPLYWPVRQAFAMETASLDAVAEALKASVDDYPKGAIMSPLLGNHDFPRFMAFADGDLVNDGPEAKEIAFNNPPEVGDPANYRKLRLAFSFLLTIPGMPLIYYGDEIGLTGAHDPDNRRFMPSPAEWTTDQRANHKMVSAWANARHESLALRRGAYVPLLVEPEVYVFARVASDEAVIVALARRPSTNAVQITLPKAWGQLKGVEALALNGAEENALKVEEGQLTLHTEPYTSGAWRLRWE